MQQTTEQSAPGRSTREAQDADEHAHNLTNWQQEYDQLSGNQAATSNTVFTNIHNKP